MKEEDSLFLFNVYCLHYYRCSHFQPLCPPPPSPSHPPPPLPSLHHHYTAVCVCGLPHILIMFFGSSLHFLSPSPSHSSPLRQLSVCSMYPCLCFYFACQFILFIKELLIFYYKFSFMLLMLMKAMFLRFPSLFRRKAWKSCLSTLSFAGRTPVKFLLDHSANYIETL